VIPISPLRPQLSKAGWGFFALGSAPGPEAFSQEEVFKNKLPLSPSERITAGAAVDLAIVCLRPRLSFDHLIESTAVRACEWICRWPATRHVNAPNTQFLFVISQGRPAPAAAQSSFDCHTKESRLCVVGNPSELTLGLQGPASKWGLFLWATFRRRPILLFQSALRRPHRPWSYSPSSTPAIAEGGHSALALGSQPPPPRLATARIAALSGTLASDRGLSCGPNGCHRYYPHRSQWPVGQPGKYYNTAPWGCAMVGGQRVCHH
jgi:hypothetical protein